MTKPVPVGLPRRFLVGLSEDERSDEATLAALRLGERLDAQLHLLHAVPLPVPGWIGETVEKYEEKCCESRTPVEAALAHRLRLREEQHGLEAGTLTDRLEVVSGDPARCLVERAVRDGIDWLFLGPHAKQSLLDFGKTARGLFHKIRCAVWIQPCEVRPPRRVLVPVDGSAVGTLALREGRALARALDLDLSILHCLDSSGNAEPRAAELEVARRGFEKYLAAFDWNAAEPRSELVTGDPVESILERQSADQVTVIGTHGTTALASNFLGHVAYPVLCRAETPMLAVREMRI